MILNGMSMDNIQYLYRITNLVRFNADILRLDLKIIFYFIFKLYCTFCNKTYRFVINCKCKMKSLLYK